MTEIKDKENINSNKDKAINSIQATPHRVIRQFFSRNSVGRRVWHDMFKVMKGENMKQKILPIKALFRLKGEIKSFNDKKKLREFSTITSFTTNVKGSF